MRSTAARGPCWRTRARYWTSRSRLSSCGPARVRLRCSPVEGRQYADGRVDRYIVLRPDGFRDELTAADARRLAAGLLDAVDSLDGPVSTRPRAARIARQAKALGLRMTQRGNVVTLSGAPVKALHGASAGIGDVLEHHPIPVLRQTRRLDHLDRPVADIESFAQLAGVQVLVGDEVDARQRLLDRGEGVVVLDDDQQRAWTDLVDVAQRFVFPVRVLQLARWRRTSSFRARRTRDALAARRARGEPLGAAQALPSEVTRRIIAERADGLTFQAIAERLMADGIPTARGKTRGFPATIKAVTISNDAAALG